MSRKIAAAPDKRPPRTKALERRVLRTMKRFRMVEPGDHVLVAVSGGPDSVALLHCLHRLSGRIGLELTVAHLNHGLRGEESDADAEFVGSLCNSLGLPLVSEKVDLRGSAGTRRGNLEEAARRARLEFLNRAADAVGAGRIALGHHRDDQAETVLLRILRGSGLEGASAIHPVVGRRVIRPLLECPRRTILDYLEELGASHRQDSTNADLKLRRNRVRHELLPYLEEHFNPRARRRLARFADLSRETADLLDSLSRKAYRDLRAGAADRISLPVTGLRRLHPALRAHVVRHAVREARGSLRKITLTHIEDILALGRPGASGKRICLPGRGLVIRQFDRLLFLPGGPPPVPDYCYHLPVPGSCGVPELGLDLSAEILDRAPPRNRQPSPSEAACLRAESIPETLLVRPRRAGDRYGGAGRRKVKRILIDARIPREERDALPMVVTADAVVWIPGLRPAKTFRPLRDSDRCVLLRVRRRGDEAGSENRAPAADAE